MIKKTTTGLFLAAAMTGASAGTLAASPTEALAAFHDALVAGDKARATGLLAADIAIYEAGHVERSREEYAGHHLGGDMEFAKNSTRKVLKQSERVDGNTAIVWQETETTGNLRGTAIRMLGTETAVLQKKNGAWSIVHVHWSSRKAK